MPSAVGSYKTRSATRAEKGYPHFSHPPSAGYYPKFGGLLAAISFQKGTAWYFDGLPAISVDFLMMMPRIA